jgi:hypothetical protein
MSNNQFKGPSLKRKRDPKYQEKELQEAFLGKISFHLLQLRRKKDSKFLQETKWRKLPQKKLLGKSQPKTWKNCF